jgi:hypothetical protein
MRPALALPTAAALALAVACGSVPSVSFYDEDGSVTDGGSLEASGEAAGGDAGHDADGALDGDAAPYCFGNPPPTGAKCCPSGGPVCYGTCNKNDCNACGPCPYPSFCCTQGPSGTCQSTPCGTDGGGD